MAKASTILMAAALLAALCVQTVVGLVQAAMPTGGDRLPTVSQLAVNAQRSSVSRELWDRPGRAFDSSVIPLVQPPKQLSSDKGNNPSTPMSTFSWLSTLSTVTADYCEVDGQEGSGSALSVDALTQALTVTLSFFEERLPQSPVPQVITLSGVDAKRGIECFPLSGKADASSEMIQLRCAWKLHYNTNTETTLELQLKSAATYRWDVQVEVDATKLPKCKKPLLRREQHSTRATGVFETALLSPTRDWSQSVWVEGSAEDATLFRTDFMASDFPNITSGAILYWSGVGASYAYVNGQRVGPSTEVLGPGTTNFAARSLYEMYDVTDLIVPNEINTIAVLLGKGWYGMVRAYDQQPKLRLQLNLPGGLTVSGTNEDSWVAIPGPITMNSIYDGNTYNASLEVPDWNTPAGRNNSLAWPSVVNISGSFAPRLDPRDFPPILINETLAPVHFWQPNATTDPNLYVFDFGREFSGFCTLTLKGSTGSVSMHYGEILDHYDAGKGRYVYFANLRGAKATDTYILPNSNSGSSQWFHYTPDFTYHGFRFVQVRFTGDVHQPTSLNSTDFVIRAHAIFSSVNLTSRFDTSSALVNKLHQHILWGQTANLMSYPTDCDQRDERLGWMADAWLSSDEAIGNFDMHRFYRSWLRDIVVDQLPITGAVGDVTPFVRYGSRPADPTWGLALPWVATAVWFNYFDRELLAEELYVPVRKWWALMVEYEASTGLENMYAYYGDWVPPAPAPKVDNSFVSAFSVVKCTELLLDLAVALGHQDDIALLQATLARFHQKFNDAFYDNNTKTYDIGLSSQTTLTLPIHLQLAPFSAAEKLLDSVEMADYHLNTGIVGLRFLFDSLSIIGHDDAALKVVTRLSYPGFAWEWSGANETAATTLWEVWNAPDQGPGMNSRNHIMDGSVDTWLQSHVGGIRRVMIQPKQGKGKAPRVGKYDPSATPAVLVNPSIASALTPIQFARQKKSFAVAGLGLEYVKVHWIKSGGTVVAEQAVQPLQGSPLVLDCGMVTDNIIEHIEFVSVGHPSGPWKASYASHRCHANATVWDYANKYCVGRTACGIPQDILVQDANTLAEECRSNAKKPLEVIVRAKCTKPVEYHLSVSWKSTEPAKKNIQQGSMVSPLFINFPRGGLSRAQIQCVNSQGMEVSVETVDTLEAVEKDRPSNVEVEAERNDVSGSFPMMRLNVPSPETTVHCTVANSQTHGPSHYYTVSPVTSAYSAPIMQCQSEKDVLVDVKASGFLWQTEMSEEQWLEESEKMGGSGPESVARWLSRATKACVGQHACSLPLPQALPASGMDVLHTFVGVCGPQ